MSQRLFQPDYSDFLADLKQHIRTPRTTAVNRELILPYWDSVRQIVEKQQTAGWAQGIIAEVRVLDGRAVVEDLSLGGESFRPILKERMKGK